MRVAIFGATGRTGRLLVEVALRSGYDVTAVARRPEAVINPGQRARVLQADITDPLAVAAAVAGQQAVLSALGSPTWKPNSVLSDGIENIVGAMLRHRGARFICMSSLGVGETRGQLGPLYNLFLIPFLLRHIFAEKERLESLIRSSALEWTIIRPGALTNRPARSRYCAELSSARPPLFPRIAREDVAEFMVRETTEGRYTRQSVSLWDC